MATLLLAEDDSGARDIARVVLERSGHQVLEAATGTEALALLGREKIDLLILDIMLPGVDGHTLLMKIAQDPKLGALPVVIFSALEYAKDLFLKFPQVKAFVSKPFTPLELEEAVGRLVPAVKL